MRGTREFRQERGREELSMANIHTMCGELEAPPGYEVRAEVMAFARIMEAALQANEHKGHWDRCDPRWLLAKLMEEVGELAQVIVGMYLPDGERIASPDEGINTAVRTGVREAADVGNLAMMLADVLAREYVE
jgi:NTP pyrophosphatase (non-canonical NTP hydrolase)